MTGAPIDRVLSRLPDARKNSRGGATARCPSHADRGPSLSITEGRDGRALLHCFAGCAPESVARAIGLTLRDLFDDSPMRDNESRAVLRQYAQAPRETIEACIVREVERARIARLDRYPFDTPNVRSADVNEARRRASAMLGVSLAPIRPFAWEGYSPHDADPMWPLLFSRALDEVARELHHFRNPDAGAWETCEPPAVLRPMAADRAAGWIHAETRLAKARLAA